MKSLFCIDSAEHNFIRDEFGDEHVCTRCGQVYDHAIYSALRKQQQQQLQNQAHRQQRQSQQQQQQQQQQQHQQPRKQDFVIPAAKLNTDYTLSGILASQMSESNRDAHGNRIVNQADMVRLRFCDKYFVNSSFNADKSLRNAIWIIATLADKLAINEQTKENAAKIYRKAYAMNAVRGRSTKLLAVASLFYACKEANIFRPPNDFMIALDPMYANDRSGRKDLFMNYKILTTVLGLPMPEVTSPVSELGSIATNAAITEKSVRKAMELYEMLRQHDDSIFFGKSPAAIAVCVLYIATKYMDENVKQDIITKAGQISTVTLRKRCDEYIAILSKIDPNFPDILLPADALIDAGEFTPEEEYTEAYTPTHIQVETYYEEAEYVEMIDAEI